MGSSEYVATVAISGTNAVMPTVTPVLVEPPSAITRCGEAFFTHNAKN